MYGSDHRMRMLSCAEQWRATAFAGLTYRQSLCDIEACLSAQPAMRYHMGIRQPISHPTSAWPNESRVWRMNAKFAEQPIRV